MNSSASFVFGNSKSRRFSDAATLQIGNKHLVKRETQTKITHSNMLSFASSVIHSTIPPEIGCLKLNADTSCTIVASTPPSVNCFLTCKAIYVTTEKLSLDKVSFMVLCLCSWRKRGRRSRINARISRPTLELSIISLPRCPSLM